MQPNRQIELSEGHETKNHTLEKGDRKQQHGKHIPWWVYTNQVSYIKLHIATYL